jgi:CheY-like chemotaxis protein
MLVEDDPLVQRLYERAFTSQGFDVTLAKDGTLVYETIRIHRPDIIVMDVMMPNFNGIETLEELKSNPDTRNIPIVMLSANDDPEIVKKALELGAVRFLFKDKVAIDQVVQTIKDIASQP